MLADLFFKCGEQGENINPIKIIIKKKRKSLSKG